MKNTCDIVFEILKISREKPATVCVYESHVVAGQMDGPKNYAGGRGIDRVFFCLSPPYRSGGGTISRQILLAPGYFSLLHQRP